MWFFQLWETLNRASQRIMLWAYRKLHAYPLDTQAETSYTRGGNEDGASRC